MGQPSSLEKSIDNKDVAGDICMFAELLNGEPVLFDTCLLLYESIL